MTSATDKGLSIIAPWNAALSYGCTGGNAAYDVVLLPITSLWDLTDGGRNQHMLMEGGGGALNTEKGDIRYGGWLVTQYGGPQSTLKEGRYSTDDMKWGGWVEVIISNTIII